MKSRTYLKYAIFLFQDFDEIGGMRMVVTNSANVFGCDQMLMIRN